MIVKLTIMVMIPIMMPEKVGAMLSIPLRINPDASVRKSIPHIIRMASPMSNLASP